ncbi:hypothetical protein HY992_01285 [Candidatus Micrarchaeota archaeon]|nr:hypothetical protein [Candidatus Micrarchaeota archaeon]
MALEKLRESVAGMIEELKKREQDQDEMLRVNRELVRECSLGIKNVHGKNLKQAAQHAKNVNDLVKKMKKHEEKFAHIASSAYQEYVELEVLLAIVQGKNIPTHEELKAPFETYLLGLCDCIGELRREMLEQLKDGDKKKAKKLFELANDLYEELMPIHFSNSLLPNFRKKQDVARIQVEQARSELLRAL